jgi:hypothetical protein
MNVAQQRSRPAQVTRNPLRHRHGRTYSPSVHSRVARPAVLAALILGTIPAVATADVEPNDVDVRAEPASTAVQNTLTVNGTLNNNQSVLDLADWYTFTVDGVHDIHIDSPLCTAQVFLRDPVTGTPSFVGSHGENLGATEPQGLSTTYEGKNTYFLAVSYPGCGFGITYGYSVTLNIAGIGSSAVPQRVDQPVVPTSTFKTQSTALHVPVDETPTIVKAESTSAQDQTLWLRYDVPAGTYKLRDRTRSGVSGVRAISYSSGTTYYDQDPAGLDSYKDSTVTGPKTLWRPVKLTGLWTVVAATITPERTAIPFDNPAPVTTPLTSPTATTPTPTTIAPATPTAPAPGKTTKVAMACTISSKSVKARKPIVGTCKNAPANQKLTVKLTRKTKTKTGKAKTGTLTVKKNAFSIPTTSLAKDTYTVQIQNGTTKLTSRTVTIR